MMTTATPGSVARPQDVVRNSWPSLIMAPQSGVGGWTPEPEVAERHDGHDN